MSDLELAVSVMHGVELSFELEPQLDLFLMIFRVLHVLLFQLESQLLLIGPVFLQLVVVITHCLHILLQNFLSFLVVLDLLFER